MRHGPKTRIIAAIMCVAILCILSPSAFAVAPHEDPEIARPVYSAISLLRYYSTALDFVLQKNPAEVEARLEKMPFANIPQSLEEATGDFASSGIGLSHLVVAVADDVSTWQALIAQCRFDEADELADQALATISRAYTGLNRVEDATEATGKELKTSLAPAGSDLRASYDEVLNRIDRIKEMLDLYASLLVDWLPGAKKIEQLLRSTDITLGVEPTVAFVGDKIRFEGELTSKGDSLAMREVDILLNGSRYVTVTTDSDGHYQGMLSVPYWYIPELDLQALYYPRDKDVGHYMASLSWVIKIEVLFYEAGLEVTLEGSAYPGRETTVAGRFDYGQSPPLDEREVEIYFDNVLITELVVPEVFEQKIGITPEADVGEHIITVSSVAAGRYSPVVDSAIINVTRATPILDLSMPKVAIIPGSVELGGRLYSEVGPLNEALIKMKLGESRVELVSSEEGIVDAEIRMGLGLGVIGSQDLLVQVLPQEPWHEPLVTTRSLVIVNIVNCGGIIAILVFFGIYLPAALRRRIGAYAGRKMAPVVAITPYQPAPAYSEDVTVKALAKGDEEDSGPPRSRIFFWYRFVVRLVQGITRAFLKPQQTLREFAKESSKVLGPAAKHFVELTKMVERLLYSQYRPSEEDAGKSRKLSQTIDEELKGEGV